MEVTKTLEYTIKFSQDEYFLFNKGIGKTSIESIINAGMTREESNFFSTMYHKLKDIS